MWSYHKVIINAPYIWPLLHPLTLQQLASISNITATKEDSSCLALSSVLWRIVEGLTIFPCRVDTHLLWLCLSLFAHFIIFHQSAAVTVHPSLYCIFCWTCLLPHTHTHKYENISSSHWFSRLGTVALLLFTGIYRYCQFIALDSWSSSGQCACKISWNIPSLTTFYHNLAETHTPAHTLVSAPHKAIPFPHCFSHHYSTSINPSAVIWMLHSHSATYTYLVFTHLSSSLPGRTYRSVCLRVCLKKRKA